MVRKWSAVLVVAALLTLVATPVALGSPKVALPNYEPMEFTSEMRHAEGPIEGLEDASAGADSTSAPGILSSGSEVGTQRTFVVIRYPSGYTLRNFTLRAVGTYGEVWVANDLKYPAGDPRNPVTVTDAQIDYILNQFDTNMYPTETEFFGSPTSHDGTNALLPFGYADGSDRVIILVDNIRDESYYDYTYPNYIAGYYSGTIEAYTDRNIITIDAYDWANRVGPNDSPWRSPDQSRWRPFLYEGTFAHEFQHLIHDDNDSDEENWINEGQSDFAEYLTGYSNLETDGHIADFLAHPYNSLVSWEDMGGRRVLADYGAAYLFQLYLDQHYGGAAFIQALHKNPLNGIEGVNDTLAQFGYKATFADVYRDWQTAVLINSSQPGNGKYKFDGLSKRVDFSANDYTGEKALAWGPNFNVISNSPKIKDITLGGIQFLGTPWSVVDDPEGNGKVLFGGTGNLTDNMLIRPIDLTGVTSATLTFDALYDIEEAWDYGFVQVSADGGNTWTSLSNADTQSILDPSAHPTVVANVPGFTGYSGGWKTETFDLTSYAGQSILVSFRYVTDWGSLGNGYLDTPGFYIRNVAVPEVGFSADGSSLGDFYGLDQIRQQYADYMVTFVGVKQRGSRAYKVLDLNLVNFDETMQKDLQQFLRDASLDHVIMAVTYAAPMGQVNPIDYSYSVEYHEDAGKSPKK